MKEYDGNNKNEAIFMKGLFRKNNEVSIDDLKCHFYVSVDKIERNINQKDHKNRFIDKKSEQMSKVIGLFIVVELLTLILSLLNEYDTADFLFNLSFVIVGIIAILRIFWLSKKIPVIITFVLFFSSLFCALAFFGIILPKIFKDFTCMLFFIEGMFFLILTVVLLFNMNKRTKEGYDLLCKIRGFKSFLETARKDELESMVVKNPSYFYDILPYTYVLEVSNKWIKNFESIVQMRPEWYESDVVFEMSSFNRFVSSSLSSTIGSAMTYRPSSSYSSGGSDFSSSSSSSSSSSGGGFSGGGSGGGGGSSW